MSNNDERLELRQAFSEWSGSYLPQQRHEVHNSDLAAAAGDQHVWTEIWDLNEQYLTNGFRAPGGDDDILAYFVCKEPWDGDAGSMRIITQMSLSCEHCDGEGFLDGEGVDCPACDGLGSVEITFDK
jgi:hypothetical protein